MATKKLKPPVKKSRTMRFSANDRKHIIPVIVKLLKTAKGPKKAVNNYWIQRYIFSQTGVKVSGIHVRKMLHIIRTTGLVKCVVASQKGYYISNSSSEILTYLATLQKRIKEIGALKGAIKKQAATVVGRQKKVKLTKKTKK
jgi:carbamoylphosphate synthase small subunit